MSSHYYLDVSLNIAGDVHYDITAAYFKKNIISTVNQIFGETASSVDVDLLKYDPKTKRAILRVPLDHYVKIRSSLTLCCQYQGDVCTYTVHKASPLLLNLQGDSRNYQH